MKPRLLPPPLLLVALLLLAAQGPLPVMAEGLRPESELSSNCFNFPEEIFTPDNCIVAINNGNTPYLPMAVGDDAIDFTLHDLDGNAWKLGETLEATGKPVVMVWGMLTCPGFQGLGTEPPWDLCSYWEERSLVGFIFVIEVLVVFGILASVFVVWCLVFYVGVFILFFCFL